MVELVVAVVTWAGLGLTLGLLLVAKRLASKAREIYRKAEEHYERAKAAYNEADRALTEARRLTKHAHREAEAWRELHDKTRS